MSKKVKVLIAIVIIIALIGICCGIRAIRNVIILNNAISKLEENIEKDNYYLKTIVKMNGSTTSTETFYREGVGKSIATDGIYTWVDGEKAYMIDEQNKEVYSMEISAENSPLLVSNDMYMSLIPGHSKNFFEKISLVGNLQNSIKSEKVNDEKCYKISVQEGQVQKTIWITKSRSFPIKAEIKFSNGDIFEYEYDLKFYITKLKDVELPDLSGYTIYDYKTKEKIQTPENNITENIENLENTVS